MQSWLRQLARAKSEIRIKIDSYTYIFLFSHACFSKRREKERKRNLARRLQLCGRPRSGYSRFDERERGREKRRDSSPQEVARLRFELRVLNISPALSLFIGASLIIPSFYDAQEKAYFLTVCQEISSLSLSPLCPRFIRTVY